MVGGNQMAPMNASESIRQKLPLAYILLKAKHSAVGFPASETVPSVISSSSEFVGFTKNCRKSNKLIEKSTTTGGQLQV